MVVTRYQRDLNVLTKSCLVASYFHLMNVETCEKTPDEV